MRYFKNCNKKCIAKIYQIPDEYEEYLYEWADITGHEFSQLKVLGYKELKMVCDHFEVNGNRYPCLALEVIKATK